MAEREFICLWSGPCKGCLSLSIHPVPTSQRTTTFLLYMCLSSPSASGTKINSSYPFSRSLHLHVYSKLTSFYKTRQLLRQYIDSKSIARSTACACILLQMNTHSLSQSCHVPAKLSFIQEYHWDHMQRNTLYLYFHNTPALTTTQIQKGRKELCVLY